MQKLAQQYSGGIQCVFQVVIFSQDLYTTLEFDEENLFWMLLCYKFVDITSSVNLRVDQKS